jgi:PAS domain-containing protein
MSFSKEIQVILARQLAGCLAMPILIADTEGTLVFYNEPAEAILNQRFEETGEMPAHEWVKLFAIADEKRNLIPLDERPMSLALTKRQPISRTVWIRTGDDTGRHVSITAFPLIGQTGKFLGAMTIFWEI